MGFRGRKEEESRKSNRNINEIRVQEQEDAQERSVGAVAKSNNKLSNKK